MKTRVIFVDDEQSVLDSLRRMLHHQSENWEMHFYSSGAAAIDALVTLGGDVLVTDLQMPGMSGKDLLRRVVAQFPNTIRIILSGMDEGESDMRKVPIAHHFLEKPCSASAVKEAIEHAILLKDLLDSSEISVFFDTTNELLSVPRIFASLTNALTNPKTTADEIAQILESDSAVSKQIIDFTNSSIVHVRSHPSTIKEAIAALGFRMIRDAALSIAFFRLQQQADGPYGMDAEVYQHSMDVARLAQKILPEPKKQNDLLLAALLHDIGKWVIAILDPDRYRATVETTHSQNISFYEAERQMYQTSHAEIGAFLLEHWGLTYPVIEGVAYHHNPFPLLSTTLSIPSALYVADALVHGRPLIEKSLKRLNIPGRIADWRQLV